MTIEGEGKAGVGAAKRAGEEMLNLAGTYFVPLGGFAFGFFGAGPKLGGAWTLGDMIYNATVKASGSAPGQLSRVCDLVAGAVFGGLFIGAGLALWHAGNKMSWAGKIVLGFFGGFFSGWGTQQLAAGIGNSLNYNGWIDSSIRSTTGD